MKLAWNTSPAVAIHMAERFKSPIVTTEVSALVRLRPKEAIDVPEALHFLLGRHLETNTRKGLQVGCLSGTRISSRRILNWLLIYDLL